MVSNTTLQQVRKIVQENVLLTDEVRQQTLVLLNPFASEEFIERTLERCQQADENLDRIIDGMGDEEQRALQVVVSKEEGRRRKELRQALQNREEEERQRALKDISLPW